MQEVSEIFKRLSRDKSKREIAYFTMEIALENDIPSYSGGLGVLAGDTLRSAADLGIPIVGVTLLQQYGYFHQGLDPSGHQIETDVRWHPELKLQQLPNYVEINIEDRKVRVHIWEYDVVGKFGYVVPVYFLDVNIPENSQKDRELNKHLYGGDQYTRLCQEIILGIGGIRVLRDLGYRDIKHYHLNEGHASLLALELIRESGYSSYDKIKQGCIFTTHTPVAAGHDVFDFNLVRQVLKPVYIDYLLEILEGEHPVNLTTISLKLSNFVNGVSMKHAEVSRDMFNYYKVEAITNGVHSATWTAPSFQRLYNQYIPGWDNDPMHFARAVFIPDEDLWKAHMVAKGKLLRFVEDETGIRMKLDRLTIAFARRAAAYKRADLLFSDLERLTKIASDKVQFVFAGKAHPKDKEGKQVILNVFDGLNKLKGKVDIAYLENYDMNLGAMITAGVDVWLNNPQRPREASGTSGMKAAHNGVLNFSVLDGWWIEGCLEAVTGWAIGPEPNKVNLADYDERQDIEDLYQKLETVLIPLYYKDRSGWIRMMKNAIAINATYFNTHRMIMEYALKAYHVAPLFQ
ncbi:alpha-glucan family phosphorylase [candidate division KSB1 bacterium]|nr:alpha-glucan family phosphorylase [candidate division KSB1 bacterium]NIR69747.1 alpha-glucan family phosphorylase [candidate division KSB1 bacterium]NIS22935.1 alpha-glucan family phosphorylase [candidate division KSB1 bacterium]NIT69792.1 alpha-glucan family phosphorylase [candidate division KSB1 bacterium]NIU23466.1 alpha-glucan family phosphorylase [candidate division KSB1 bacterium]